MPQMSPINWLSLFIIFIITLILFNVMNYFSYNINSKNNIAPKSYTSLNLTWKW